MTAHRRVLVEPQPSGRVRVRVERPDGAFRSVGAFPPTEADNVAEHMRELLHASTTGTRERPTLRSVTERWQTSRELSGVKRAAGEIGRWALHVLADLIADIPFDSLTARHVRDWRKRVERKMVEKVFRGGKRKVLPRKLSPKTVKEMLQLVRSCLDFAVEEELLPRNVARDVKAPRGHKRHKAKTFLRPEHDTQLLRCADVPLCLRLMYGFLAREGMRISEAFALERSDLDLDAGTVNLDENKTDDPRSWKLDLGVVRALRAWLKLPRKAGDGDRLFVNTQGLPWSSLPKVSDFHQHLRAAGVEFAEYFETTPARLHLRIHDLRATFVTLALAAGESETWVTDRTGHRSHAMVQAYRRRARMAAELRLGKLAPLDHAIPELRAHVEPQPTAGGGVIRSVIRSARNSAPHRGIPVALLTRRSGVRVPLDPPLATIQRGASAWRSIRGTGGGRRFVSSRPPLRRAGKFR